MRAIMALLVLILSVHIGTAQEDLIRQNWRAQYYGNAILDGPPIDERFDGGIGYDWGLGSPGDDIPSDNFSVRWGKGGFLPAGTYRFIVTADEGFRLYVDDEVILDFWDGGARGQTVGRDIFLEAGEHKLQVDYRELEGDALIFLDWGLAPTSQPVASAPASSSATTVTIAAARLNVRSTPQIADNIVGRVSAGEQYALLERSADNSWVRLEPGWVSAAFVQIDSDSVDVAPALQGLTLQANARLNVRSAPNTTSDILGVLVPGQIVPIIARNSDASWWQISANGQIGWVSGSGITHSPAVIPQTIRIAGAAS